VKVAVWVAYLGCKTYVTLIQKMLSWKVTRSEIHSVITVE